ncbi:MAG: MOSC domain-containing protein [Candidatus Thermoplasmatota archaeon]
MKPGSLKGVVVSINIGASKGRRKSGVRKARITSLGLEGDAHAGEGERQVSLLAQEWIESQGHRPGDFAENITTKGIALRELALGTHLRVGRALVEITQRGKECHTECEIRRQTGRCIMRTEGIFARVLVPGEVKIGDSVEVVRSRMDRRTP